MRTQRASSVQTALLVGASALAIAGTATAQTSSAGSSVGLEEVVVTAQNRAQSLQEVPLAISAITGEKLAAEHIATFADIAKVAPGFVSAPNYGYIRYSSMRGISNNQFGFADDPSIALFVDGVYQGRGGTGMQTNAAFDVDRIEVIKGPQATLFGRSSIAGAISIITRQPTFDGFSADGMVGVGNYNRLVARGAVNLPLSENLALRLAATSENRDQVFEDLGDRGGLGGVNVKAARATLAYRGDSGLRLTLKGTVERRRENAFPVQTVEQPKFKLTHSIGGRQAPADFDIYEGVAKVEYDLSDALSATLTNSIRQVDNYFVLDYDARPEIVGGPYAQETKDRVIGQDLIFVYEEGPISASFGGSWFKENLSGYVGNWVNSTLAFTGAFPTGLIPGDYSQAFYELGYYDGKFHGYSVFADATYEVTPSLRLTGGVRFNSDTKRYTHNIPNPAVLPQNAGKAFAGAYYNWGYWTSAPISAKDTWKDVAFRASVSYDISSAVTTYLSFNQGWKAGGIDSFRTVTPAPFPYYFGLDVAAAGGTPNVYDPENSDSYEFGLKGRFLDGRLTTNLALYQYKYRDLQVNVTRGNTVIVENVGRARGRGGELEIRAIPLDGLELFSNTAYTDTNINSFPDSPDQVGLPLNRAPLWSGSAGAIATLPIGAPGEVKFQADVSYRSKLRADNALVYLVPGYALVNARLSYTTEDGKYGVTAYVENIFNKLTWNDGAIRRAFSAAPFDTRSVFGDPRFFGVDLTVRY